MQYYKHNPKLTPNAKRLRREMTPEERKLWYLFFKNFPVRVLRQKVIDNYIVDFYCAKAKLVIEIDGSQHYEEAGEKMDCIRDEALSKHGLKVLRIPNNAVNQEFASVCEYITNTIYERTAQE